MHEKPITPLSILIFGIAEIVVGFIGCIFFVKQVLAYVKSMGLGMESSGLEGALALVGIFVYLPAPLVLTAGLGIMIGLGLGKNLNNKLMSLLYLMLVALVIFHIYSKNYATVIIDVIIFLIFSIPLQWFLNHPQVKSLETRQY